jgi:hypothetical protein
MTLSQAFAEKHGSGAETAFGNEGDRFYKRAEIEAQHAESWADEQERKYHEAPRARLRSAMKRSTSTASYQPRRPARSDWPRSEYGRR